jgi:hypothetical protein
MITGLLTAAPPLGPIAPTGALDAAPAEQRVYHPSLAVAGCRWPSLAVADRPWRSPAGVWDRPDQANASGRRTGGDTVGLIRRPKGGTMATPSGRYSGWRASVPGLILLVLGLAGCAAESTRTERALQPGDLPRLAGQWTWTTPLESPARLGPGPIKVRIEGGKLLFETATASGSLTLEEGPNGRVLRGEGQDKVGGRRFPIQLTQRQGSQPVGGQPVTIVPE